jgi:hypothetical protein
VYVRLVGAGLQFDALDEQLADGAEFDHPLFPKLLG